jgi:hypothetical protein
MRIQHMMHRPWLGRSTPVTSAAYPWQYAKSLKYCYFIRFGVLNCYSLVQKSKKRHPQMIYSPFVGSARLSCNTTVTSAVDFGDARFAEYCRLYNTSSFRSAICGVGKANALAFANTIKKIIITVSKTRSLAYRQAGFGFALTFSLLTFFCVKTKESKTI